VKAALARLGGLGSILSQDLSVQDLQHDFVVQSAQIAQLRSTIAALQAALRDPSLPDGQRVLLRIRLASSKRAFSERLHARQGTAALYALIVLSPLAFAALLAWTVREARRRRDDRLVME
jgi:hypothetical protein